MDSLRSLIKVILILSIGTLIVTFFLRDLKPGKNTVLPELQNPPTQSEVSLPAFQVNKNNLVYTVYPQYNYEFRAMVVSYMNNESWMSRFRETDPLNIKDICIVYGSNASSGVYQKMKIYSEEFACKFKMAADFTGQFNETEMANNHLLPGTDEVYKNIKNTRIGDQVYLKGYLVNYAANDKTSGTIASKRETSTIRSDEKCESIYVTDYKILKTANKTTRDIFMISEIAIVGSFLVLIIISIVNMGKIPTEKEMQYIPEGCLTREQIKAQVEAKIAQRKKLEACKKK